ncbi:fatty acid hydroxylase domain-containing protein 2-like [Saccoglossus kowalevskii]|uniref:Fatty acid hydroxylase domain-containing protein 2-like n=1 Tax=Saccoglossus kowalevskii TaxID=10224 RepID=A0ABM0GUQ6_SACKO|nr:PREDICTED: fatty acid hydroxylase domain-containing protein 2-like [Saccoglossus kowalevskii]
MYAVLSLVLVLTVDFVVQRTKSVTIGVVGFCEVELGSLTYCITHWYQQKPFFKQRKSSFLVERRINIPKTLVKSDAAFVDDVGSCKSKFQLQSLVLDENGRCDLVERRPRDLDETRVHGTVTSERIQENQYVDTVSQWRIQFDLGTHSGHTVDCTLLAVIFSMETLHTVTFTQPRFFVDGWRRIYQAFGENEFLLNTVGTVLVINITYWTVGLLLLSIDLTRKPAFLWKYKVQPDKNAPLDPSVLPGVFRTTIFNMVVVFYLCSVFFYKAGQWRGYSSSCSVEDVPTIPRILFDLIVAVVGEEVVFYYTHRLFHHPYLYKRFHKKHHEWTAPIGLIALYAHPLEHALSNALAAVAGAFVVQSHLLSIWIWLVIAVYSTQITHSGYHFPFTLSPQFHDFHHAKFNYCYGAIGVLDYLHGTDTLYRKSISHRRHKTIFNLTPIHESIPIDNFKKD